MAWPAEGQDCGYQLLPQLRKQVHYQAPPPGYQRGRRGAGRDKWGQGEGVALPHSPSRGQARHGSCSGFAEALGRHTDSPLPGLFLAPDLGRSGEPRTPPRADSKAPVPPVLGGWGTQFQCPPLSCPESRVQGLLTSGNRMCVCACVQVWVSECACLFKGSWGLGLEVMESASPSWKGVRRWGPHGWPLNAVQRLVVGESPNVGRCP